MILVMLLILVVVLVIPVMVVIKVEVVLVMIEVTEMILMVEAIVMILLPLMQLWRRGRRSWSRTTVSHPSKSTRYLTSTTTTHDCVFILLVTVPDVWSLIECLWKTIHKNECSRLGPLLQYIPTNVPSSTTYHTF